MADTLKVNINGIDINANVPEWASESTLQNINQAIRRNNELFQQLSGSVQEIDKGMNTAAGRTEDVRREVKDFGELTKRSIGDRVSKVTTRLTGILGKLSNTQKPISTTFNLAQDLPGMAGSAMSLFRKNVGKAGEAATGKMGKLGEMAKVGGTAFTTYAALAGAKFEQFSEVQQSMIDSGAVMFSNISAFEELRIGAYDAGIAYEDLGKIVNNYGGAIQSLGNNISQGTSNFTNMFREMNDAADTFGDFGMQSSQMAETYAGFIDAQRLTGTVNRNTVDAQDKLKAGFTTLMLETSALASVTGENRQDIIKRRMAKLTDAEVASSINRFYEMGYTSQADAIKAIQTELSDLEADLGPLGAKLTEAVTNASMEAGGDPTLFDVRRNLRDIDPAIMNRLNSVAPGLLDKIDKAVQTGNIADAGNMIRKELLNADTKALGSAAGGANSAIFQADKEIRLSLQNLRMNQKKRGEMSDKEFEKVTNETAKGLAESGKTVKVVNDATEMFFKAQAALLPDMDNMADLLGGTTESIKDLKNWSENILSDQDESLNSTAIGNMFSTSDATIKDLLDKATLGNATSEDWKQLAIAFDELEREEARDSGVFGWLAGSLGSILGVVTDPINDLLGQGWIGTIFGGGSGRRIVGREGSDDRDKGEQELIQRIREKLDSKQERFNAEMQNNPQNPNFGSAGTQTSYVLVDGRPVTKEDPLSETQIDFLNNMYESDPERVKNRFPSWLFKKFMDARQFGGPVTTDTPYLVGEGGMEIFIPAQDGYILNNEDTNRIIQAVEQLGLSGLNSVFAAARAGTTEQIQNAIPYEGDSAVFKADEDIRGAMAMGAGYTGPMSEAPEDFINSINQMTSGVTPVTSDVFSSNIVNDMLANLERLQTSGTAIEDMPQTSDSNADVEEELKSIRQMKENMLVSLLELRDLVRTENTHRDRKRTYNAGNL